MKASHNLGSMADSPAFAALSIHLEHASGSTDTLKTILWMIGAHPQLLAHAEIFSTVEELLQTPTFSPPCLYWSSPWRDEVNDWKGTLAQIRTLESAPQSDPELAAMYRLARHDRDHPLLRHGVTRHPIAAALFNRYQPNDDEWATVAQTRFQSMRAHVLAVYFEARSRAAQGREQFMNHHGQKEFAPVPVGAGPVGLALREFSHSKYSPLLLQLPDEVCTVDFAAAITVLQPNYSRVPLHDRRDAARYFHDLQRYFNALPALLNRSDLNSRTRKGTDTVDGEGGHMLRPGWVFDNARITKQLDLDWADDAPNVTQVYLPLDGEPDPNDEELDGDCPGASRDTAIELYDATDAARIMSRMRFRQLAQELRGQEFHWSMDMASAEERDRALRVAQHWIDEYVAGQPTNQTVARLRAIGGVLVKAAALYGWKPETTAAIAARRIDCLDTQTIESVGYVRHDQITLLASRVDHEASGCWSPLAFLVPGLAPSYATKLPADVEATGRLRQSAFLLADVGGLGRDLLAIAARTDRLTTNAPLQKRLLGVEGKTAAKLARECASSAADPSCDDPRAALTVRRLCSSVQAAISHVSGDSVPSWMISNDSSRTSEARLHYTQVRAASLATWHAQALAWLSPAMASYSAGAEAIASLQPGWVGCRHVADLEKAHGFIDGLRGEVSSAPDLDRRSSVRRYHNSYTLLAWLCESLPLGLRPIVDGPRLNHLHELRRGMSLYGSTDAAGIVDKHHAHQDKARLVPITPEWQAAVQQLERHNATVIQRLDLLAEWQALDASGQRAFIIAEDETLTAMTPAWIKAQLIARGFPAPANFGRALLRTEWLDQGCKGRDIDALLGHFSHGQSSFSKHSSHDPAAYLDSITQQLPIYMDHLHLKLPTSLCIAAIDRHATLNQRVHLPRIGRKAPSTPPKLRTIWDGCDSAPPLPEPVQAVWSAVDRHSAGPDRAARIGLLWTLRNSTNPHAKVLTGRPLDGTEEADEDSARGIEDQLMMTMQRLGLPRACLASWLRLMLAAVRRLQDLGIHIAATKVAAITSPPDSPITVKATQRLPDVMAWRAALYSWVALRAVDPNDDPRFWAIAIALSATMHGMVLDLALLARVIELLAEPGPRRLHLCGSEDGPSFLTFWLPSSTPGGQQLTRWFLDPVTELLILRSPTFPEAPTLRSMAKDLNRFLVHHGAPPDRCPGNWQNVIRAVRAFWSTRVPQHLIQVGHRGIATTSLRDACWNRLFGHRELRSSQPGSAPLTGVAELTVTDLAQRAESDHRSANLPAADRDVAMTVASAAFGADFDHVLHDQRSAHPWMLNAWEALAPGSDLHDVIATLTAFQRAATDSPFRFGALGWLMRATASLMQDALREQGDALIGLRRVVSTLLPRLSAQMAGRWFDTMSPAESAAVLAALTHDIDAAASRPDLRRGLRLLLQFEPSLTSLDTDSGGQSKSTDAIDLEDIDADDKVDARIFTIDEYERAREVLQLGMDPPLSPVDQQDLHDLLDLGTWSLARPREYLEARIGDFEARDGLTLIVCEYHGHTLKTPQAVRRVPLSLLAPAPVVQRLRDRLQRRQAQHADPRGPQTLHSLLFEPPPGVAALDHHNRLLRLLQQVLRRVTGDRGFRPYSLRHAAANWMLLALEGKDDDIWREVWSSHPAMAQWLDQREALREHLLGSSNRTDRRALLAITKIQGHLAAATTYMHYLHLSCLLQLQAVRELADEMPQSVLAAAAGLAPSSFSEQLAKGWSHLLRNARARAGWTVVDLATTAKPRDETKDAVRWLSFEDLSLLLNAHAVHQQPLSSIAQHFQMQQAQVSAILRAAAEIGLLVGAEPTSPDARTDVQGVRMPAARMNDAERLQMDHWLMNMQARWLHDRRCTQDTIALMMDCMDRHHREWRFNDPRELRQCTMFLQDCHVAPNELQVVLRRRDPHAETPHWALIALGPYVASAVKVAQPDTLSSDAALAQWVCLRLVDRRGDGIPNVAARALFAAHLNMTAWACGTADS